MKVAGQATGNGNCATVGRLTDGIVNMKILFLDSYLAISLKIELYKKAPNLSIGSLVF